MPMNIILVGAGKIGYTLAAQLTKEGHDVTVIDRDRDRLTQIASGLDVMTVCGTADVDLLRLAGAEKADLLIAVTQSDETNILCCMVGRKLGAGHTIARVRQEEHYREVVLLRKELGLSLTINPGYAAANEISRILRFPSAAKVEPFAKGQAELVELKLAENNPLCGTSLQDYHVRFGNGTLICGVQRGENAYIPGGDFILRQGDAVSIVGSPRHIHKLFRTLDIFKRGARYVMIVGGSRVSVYLARQLLGMGIHVKILEIREDKCARIKDAVPKAEVVCCDGSQPEILEEEGMPAFDAFVSLTDSDEINVLVAAYAMRAGIDKVITKTNTGHYAGFSSYLGLEEPIQPHMIAARQVIRYIRGMEKSAEASGLESLRQIMNGKLEVLEFIVHEGSVCAGRTLIDLPIRKGVLLAAVIRDGQCIIPHGGDMLYPGDSVLAVSSIPGMSNLDDILKG